jgi:hypothetical protein
LAAVVCLAMSAAAQPASGGFLELHKATVFAPNSLTARERKAVQMLVEEVEERTQIRWTVTDVEPSPGLINARGVAVIAVGPAAALDTLAGSDTDKLISATPGPEGYRLQTGSRQGIPAVYVVGNDERGVLFGVGGLLRALRMCRQRVSVPAPLQVSTAPRTSMRGHQLGYRPKTNSYDAWSLPMWEQYFRDLAIFGCNAVELIPPRSDDDADSAHFPKPPMEMMVGMSRVLDEYGMDVTIWYPAMDEDYSKTETVEFALKEWGEVFDKLPRIDAVFVPGGDPGHTQPKYLMALLEKMVPVLHRKHPKATLWVAPQGFSQAWMDEFVEIMRTEPAWLHGIVFGPQVRYPLPKLRSLIPARYPIRHYPDITHSRQCQYPVPEWDQAFAVTEAREGVNPRPRHMARIYELMQPHTIGFITYSEGCNDDVNKCVWSALGWDPKVDLHQVLREYGRVYVSQRCEEGVAQGIFALEQNWRAPLMSNAGVASTLQQFQDLERTATPQERGNWRFQQLLYRAYYDAYVRARLIHETAAEERAMDVLRRAPQVGGLPAMAEAEAILDAAAANRPASDLRARVFELAEALFQSIRMQLSVDRYQAIAVGRGANLDTIDMPLNSRAWLKSRFAALRAGATEAGRLTGISEIVNWTNPGPAGFYDELGNVVNRPHLVLGKGSWDDPAYWESALTGFSQPENGRISWWRNAEALHDNTLKLHYRGLDPTATYRVRATYSGDGPQWKLRLTAGEGIEVHPFIPKPLPVAPVEFAIPASAVRNGDLTLTWETEKGRPGNGRGCQVAEVWLIRVSAPAP